VEVMRVDDPLEFIEPVVREYGAFEGEVFRTPTGEVFAVGLIENKEDVELELGRKLEGEAVFQVEEGMAVPKAPEEVGELKIVEDSEVKKKKIVSHRPPRHTDDAVALALLTQKYPDAELEFLSPQDPKLEEYRKDPSVILVDVGMAYSPEFRNYDHHHDSDVSSSLMLVLKHEFPEYLKAIETDPLMMKSLEFIDLKDRFGPFKAKEITGIDPAGAYFLEEALKELSSTEEGLRALGQALKRRFDAEADILRKLEKVEVREIKGLKVAVDREGAPGGRVFGYTGADLLIQRNARNPQQTSVVRNSASPKASVIESSALKDEAVFVHPNGFMAVLSKPIEEVNPEEIVEKVMGRDRGIEL